MIEVSNLTKYYGEVPAIQDVSFCVEKGEIVGFLGPNGAGKTTTMRILAGYMPPSRGKAAVAGFDVVRAPLEVRRRVGYMPETVPLYPEMSVADYLDFMARLRHVPDRRARIAEVMAQLGLAERANDRIAKLSKGYRQRVGLAQAILHEPDVLILDEPTIGLDPRQIIEVRNLIRSLGERHTILLSTHILPEVSQVADRVLIINKGRLVAEDTPEGLTALLSGGRRLRVELRADAAAPEHVRHVLSNVPGVKEVIPEQDGGTFTVIAQPESDPRAALAQTIVGHGWRLLELHTVTMTLEDIFLQLTTQEPASDG